MLGPEKIPTSENEARLIAEASAGSSEALSDNTQEAPLSPVPSSSDVSSLLPTSGDAVAATMQDSDVRSNEKVDRQEDYEALPHDELCRILREREKQILAAMSQNAMLMESMSQVKSQSKQLPASARSASMVKFSRMLLFLARWLT